MRYFTYFVFCLIFVLAVEAANTKLTRIGKYGRKTIYIQSEDKQLDWPSSKAFCSQNGMKLASIESKPENDAIRSHLYERAKAGDDANHLWLGGTDQAIEGKWMWVADGSTIKFNHWKVNEPATGTYNNCLYVSPKNPAEEGGTWTATYCELGGRAVCQKLD